MPSHNRQTTRAIVNAARNKRRVFYYKGSDFGILDARGESVYQDYQYVSMLWNSGLGYAGHSSIGGTVNFNRGDIVQNTWSVNIYSDKQCLHKIGDITWNISAQVPDPSLGFSQQKLNTNELISVKFLKKEDQFCVSGKTCNSIMGGYYELDKDVIVKVSDNLKMGPLEKNDLKKHKVDDYRSIRIRKIDSNTRKCLLSTSGMPEKFHNN